MGRTGKSVLGEMFLKALEQEPIMRVMRVDLVGHDKSFSIIINTN